MNRQFWSSREKKIIFYNWSTCTIFNKSTHRARSYTRNAAQERLKWLQLSYGHHWVFFKHFTLWSSLSRQCVWWMMCKDDFCDGKEVMCQGLQQSLIRMQDKCVRVCIWSTERHAYARADQHFKIFSPYLTTGANTTQISLLISSFSLLHHPIKRSR